MIDCSDKVKNKEGILVPSILSISLRNSKIFGRDLSIEQANKVYHAVYNDTSFKDWFGDWKSDDFDPTKLDENSEPNVKEVLKWAKDFIPEFSNNNLGKMIGELKVITERNIKIAETRLSKLNETGGSDISIKRASERLKDLSNRLSTLDELKAVEAFIVDGLRVSKASINRLDKIFSKYDNGETVTNEDINSIAALHSFIQSYDIVKDVKPLLRGKDVTGLMANLYKLENNIDEINDKYYNIGLPILADFLLEYMPKNINKELQTEIDNLWDKRRVDRKNLVSNLDEYKKLEKNRKLGKISKLQYENSVLKLIEQHLKNKLISRESLIKWLKESTKDKSQFSVLFDPIIYSSDSSIALFSKALKDSMFKAEMNSRDVLFELSNAYGEFTKDVSALTNKELNKDLYETIEIQEYNPETNENEIKNVLSFVQEFDINRHQESEIQVKKNASDIALKLTKEKEGWNNVSVPKDKDNYEAWIKTEPGKFYKKEYDKIIGKWYEENTQPIENAHEIGSKKVDRLTEVNKIINKLLLSNKVEDAVNLELYELEKDELDNWLKYNYRWNNFKKEYIPRGSLVKPSEQYKNEKWLKIQSNDRLRKYYNTLISQFHKDQDKLPSGSLHTNKWEDYSYIVPSTRISNKDRKLEQGLKSNFKEIGKDLQVQSTDTQYEAVNQEGEQIKNIPIYYTNLVDEQDITKDLVYAVAKFNQMAEEYKAKSEIHGQVNIMLDVIENRDTAITNSLGQTKFEAVASKYGIDKFIKKPGVSNNFQHLKDFVDMFFYGKTKDKSTFNLFGKEIDANKLTDKLITYTATNSLAGNFLQSVSNVTVGETMLLTEASAGKFFNLKDLAKGSVEYFKQLGAIKDFKKGKASTKLGQLIEIFDPIQGTFKDSFGNDISGSKLKKMLSSDTLFLLQHVGEHELQTRSMIAMMLHKRVKTKDGKETTLYDSIKPDENGRITIKSIVNNLQDFSEQDLLEFRNALHGVNGKLNGKYNEFDKASIKKKWYGRLLMLYRGFVVPFYRRRYGHGDGVHVDIESGTITQGTYTTFFNNIKAGFLKYGLQFWKMRNDLTPQEVANFKRTMTEMYMLIAVSVLINILSSEDDDDKDKSWGANFTAYQARRLQSELLTFTPLIGIGEAWRIVKSPTATMNTVQKAYRLLGQVTSNPFEEYSRDSGVWEKGDNKLKARIIDLIPVINTINRSRTPEEALKYFNLLGFK